MEILSAGIQERTHKVKNQCKDIAHTFLHATDLDYVTSKNKINHCSVDHCWSLII
jgi:hypothetical protein